MVYNKYKQITVLLSVVYKSADVASCIFPWPGMDWLQAAMESR